VKFCSILHFIFKYVYSLVNWVLCVNMTVQDMDKLPHLKQTWSNTNTNWWWDMKSITVWRWQPSGILYCVNTSEMSVSFYETKWCNIPEGCHSHTYRHENLKSQLQCFFMIFNLELFINSFLRKARFVSWNICDYPDFVVKLIMRLDILLQSIKFYLTYSSGTKMTDYFFNIRKNIFIQIELDWR
jgi:hypothetical protein